jgi:hypothetical protein
MDIFTVEDCKRHLLHVPSAAAKSQKMCMRGEAKPGKLVLISSPHPSSSSSSFSSSSHSTSESRGGGGGGIVEDVGDSLSEVEPATVVTSTRARKGGRKAVKETTTTHHQLPRIQITPIHTRPRKKGLKGKRRITQKIKEKF